MGLISLFRRSPRELDVHAFARSAARIREEVRHRVADCVRTGDGSPARLRQILHEVFIELYARTYTPSELTAYMFIAARIMRGAVIDAGLARGRRLGGVEISRWALEQWLIRVEAYNPVGARMVDLHYFAGCSVRETARVLGMSPRTVLGDLRFSKEFLQARLERTAKR
jgi:DNA-directed RNA polymerase specialized sigma24 family protein